MEYTIKTLEIEIAKLEAVIRKAYETPFTAADYNDGHFPDIDGLRRKIGELEKAVEVLSIWAQDNPEQAFFLETGLRNA